MDNIFTTEQRLKVRRDACRSVKCRFSHGTTGNCFSRNAILERQEEEEMTIELFSSMLAKQEAKSLKNLQVLLETKQVLEELKAGFIITRNTQDTTENAHKFSPVSLGQNEFFLFHRNE